MPAMDLTTQCPQCGTTFQASLEQLQLRKGYIRCVHCAHIFDGYEAVVPAGTPSAHAPGAIAEVPPQVVRNRREFTISGQSAQSASASEPSFGISGADSQETSPLDDQVEHVIADPGAHRISDSDTAHTIGSIRQGRDVRDSRRDVDTLDRPGPVREQPEHVYVQPRSTPPHHGATHAQSVDVHTDRWESLIRLFWLVLTVVGVVVFALQLLYVFRVQIAEQVPSLRPRLEHMCSKLNCKVAWSRRPELIMITQSSLQMDGSADDDAENDTLTLQLTLRNAYDKPQEWPTLVLDLKDFSGALIARKNLAAPVYLPDDVAAGPFPANSERRIQLPLTLQGLKVNGYQLTTFFP